MTQKNKINEVGSVGLQRIIHKRKRTLGDPLSIGKVTTKHQASKGFRTEGERETGALKIRQATTRGDYGGGASRKIHNRRAGLAEHSWKSTLLENIIDEARRSNAQLDFILGKDKEGKDKPAAPKAMSGATRTLRRGLRKAKNTGKGNAGEDLINSVPKKWGAMMRRGRKARNK